MELNASDSVRVPGPTPRSHPLEDDDEIIFDGCRTFDPRSLDVALWGYVNLIGGIIFF